MPDTHGFEVVAEIAQSVLQQILLGAWTNGIIPHSTPISAGLMFGPYQTAGGTVNIPSTGLAVGEDPANNELVFTLPAEIQVTIANPPIPSASLFDMNADIRVEAPVQTLPGTINVGIILANLPRGNVSASLTSGDPIGPLTLAMIAEYVHAKYQDGTIPATLLQNGVSFGIYTADAWTDIYDDATKPNHQIVVTQPDPTHVKISIPIHLRLSNLHAAGGIQPLSPIGVAAKIAITTPLNVSPGLVSAPIATQGTITIEDFGPAPAMDEGISYDSEGANYSVDKTGAAAFGIDLDSLVQAQIMDRAHTLVNALGDRNVVIPTQSQIESFIADQAHAALIARGNIGLWTPNTPSGNNVNVNDVTPQVLADALAICINNTGGANAAVVTNFIPSGLSCAIAMQGAKVLAIIWQQIKRPESDGGFGPDFPHTPKTFHNIDGHDARLTSLDISLRSGSIHMSGDVTVVNAIAGKWDVDAGFDADAGLKWVDNPDGSGTQQIQPFTIGTPDIHLSALAWLVSLLIGFITGGLIGGIIAIVVMAVATGVADRVGGQVVSNQVTGQIMGVGPWPQTLEGIGEVVARFENPIEIDPDGISFPDAFNIVATFASTVDALARANGPYATPGGSPLSLNGGPLKPDTQYMWQTGDGASAPSASILHAYGRSGVYVSEFTTTVTEPGGVTTQQYAMVRVSNVPATVNAGPAMTVNEGQVVDYTLQFTDPEWLDTHKVVFDFGDDSMPIEVTPNETHNPPEAKGSATFNHAYCHEGVYTLGVIVRDEAGGLGTATRTVTVLNVPPKVDVGPDLFAYPCAPISLEACFTDPGWCDTHTGTWDFGDCTPVQPAIIREKHEPPIGIGVAAALHTYDECGTFRANCTVTDDGGLSDRGILFVSVVNVRNAHFEGGFRNRREGTIANQWEPCVASAGDLAGVAATVFEAEEFVVHRGERSQRINGRGNSSAGIYQRVGANPGWDYQVTAWYHLDARAGGVCRLGVDPAGGTDPSASGIAWSHGNVLGEWTQLAVRVAATSRAITIFLVSDATVGDLASYWDDVALLPYPCPIKECQPPRPPKEQKACVDWQEERERRVLGHSYEKNGFQFQAEGQEPLRLETWGMPAGQGKLVLVPAGVGVVLPFAADRVTAEVETYKEPIVLKAFDANGAELGQAASTGQPGVSQTLEVTGQDITRLVMTSGDGLGLLVKLCVYTQGDEREVGDEKRTV